MRPPSRNHDALKAQSMGTPVADDRTWHKPLPNNGRVSIGAFFAPGAKRRRRAIDW